MISDLIWDFYTLVSFDCHLEDISAWFSILSFVIASLNNKFNWFSNSLFFQQAWPKAKRFKSSCIHKVIERNKSGGKFITKYRKLNGAFFWTKCFKVWCDCSQLSFTYINTRGFKCEFCGYVRWLFTYSEVDFYTLIFKSLSFYSHWNTASKLTERWINFGNSIAWTNDFTNT